MNNGAGGQNARGGVDLAALAALSGREREVLDLALAGLSAKAIADELTLTQATIRSHLSRIYAKLGVAGRVDLLAKLSRQLPDRESPPTPAVQPAPPRRRRAWPVVTALAISFVIVGAGALLLWLRPDLPPSTNLATVSQLVDQGQATSLDLRGDTLYVATTDGRHYRVDGVSSAALVEVQSRAEAKMGATVEITVERGDSLTPTSFFATVMPFAPLILLVAVAVVLFRLLRRPPRFRPAS